MYIYYEHHRDANKKIVLTELRVSSDPNGKLAIYFHLKTENMVFEACKPLLKFPPIANYSYDPALKIWSYFGQYGVSSTYGEEVIKKLQTIIKALGQTCKTFEIEDLSGQAVNDRVDLSGKKTPKLKAEEFFYTHTQPAAKLELTKEQIELKFKSLTGFSYLDKKSYRQAAMLYHPDRIGGSAAKMSELNMLWNAWQEQEKLQCLSI